MRTERVEYAGFDSRVIRTAPEAGKPTLLFLHGYGDSADGWRRVQRRLAEVGYGTAAVDQPSHGEADALSADRPLADQFLEFAAAAAKDADGGHGVIAVGNSLGGAHALLLAARHPELVRGCAAISPASFDHPRWMVNAIDEERGAARALRARGQRAMQEANPTRRQVAMRRAVANVGMRTVAFGRPWRAPAGFVDQWRQQFGDPERRRALRDLARRVPAEYLAVDFVDLTAIDVPVLALWGNRDRLTLLSSRERFEREIADLEFVELRGIGHMPQLETPGLTTKYLRRFAERVSDA